MPDQRRHRLRIPPLAWALLISLALHVLLALLIVQPPHQPRMAANGSFIFHARMEAAAAASPALQLAPPPPAENISALPAQPPAPVPALEAPALPPVERYYEVNELDAAPAPKQDIVPQYPAEALKARMTGMVQLEMYLDASGTIQSLRVLRSTTPGLFDQAALDAFQHQPFAPGIKDGRPVRARLKLVVNFGDHPGDGLQ